MAENFSEEEGKDDTDRDYSPFSDEETEGSFSSESASEVIDMEWEEGKFSDAELQDETDNSSKMDDESESVSGCSSEILSDCNVDVIQDYDFESCKEETACFEGEVAEEIFTGRDMEIQESGQQSASSIYDQISCAEDEFDNVSSKKENLEEDNNIDCMHILMAATSSMEEPSEEMRITAAEAENMMNPTEVTEEGSSNNPVDESSEDNETNGGQNGNQKTEEASDTDKQVDYSSDILEETDQATDAAEVSEECPSADSTPEPQEAAFPKIEENINSSNLEQDIDQNQNALLKGRHVCEDQDDIKQKNPPETMEDSKSENGTMEAENKAEQQSQRPLTFSRLEQSKHDQDELCNKWNRSRRGIKDLEDETTRKFNPREPNYLPFMAEPEGEKVDLRHQMMDERKNSEEWMIDYALQQTVTKLAPLCLLKLSKLSLQ